MLWFFLNGDFDDSGVGFKGLTPEVIKARQEVRELHPVFNICERIEKVLAILIFIIGIVFPVYCVITGSYVQFISLTGHTSYFIVAIMDSIIIVCSAVALLVYTVFWRAIESALVRVVLDKI